MNAQTKVPVSVRLHRASRMLELGYGNDETYSLSCEFLRVQSPSAEVRGHGPGQETLQSGKRLVTIERIETVGNYALQFHFSDGHDSGIYSWDYLYSLCRDQQRLWADYLARMALAGASREPAGPVLIARQ
ncbi:MAG: DUF971 domain-containing protein [Pseudomonadales bacterium]|jgi:DUF971 family protein|nr:DUF971 domain-containing protein [Pseudomonadales bacterium]MCP5322212.1 DUF971 domain-containing protein [Pseudomonadales bacterium]MCP5337098.1 DUF971 domain-containing protein [Pseudomonadales bacterium]